MSEHFPELDSATPQFKNLNKIYFEEYFTDEKIIDLLCKYRVKVARSKHKHHLFREISVASIAKRNIAKQANNNTEINSLLPPRRQWKRPCKDERAKHKNSQTLTIASIKNTIKFAYKKYSGCHNDEKPIWFISLCEFIEVINDSVHNPNKNIIDAPIIKAVKKEDKKDCIECRALSIYSLKDKIIISLTAKYFTDLFDDYFLDCSYAFRSVRNRTQSVTHHDAIKRIIEYKQNNSSDLWVAECDIVKFFDCVNHKLVLTTLHKNIKDYKIPLDNNALTLFESYLLSYSFNHNVLIKNNSEFFENTALAGCYFPWPDERLLIDFYEESGIHKERIGVPQGGAISCFIANLIMNEVDKSVINNKSDKNLLYIRYCDDMIIIHPEKEKCQMALKTYQTEIANQKLLIHRSNPLKEYGREFWDKKNKSKDPYKWADKNALISNVPWLSFVGYQMRYDGFIRIRKHSLEKELKKQKKEINEVLSALEQNINNYYPDTDSVDINSVSLKSREHHIHAIQNRLISMSVGRLKLHTKDQAFDLCWTNGFKALNQNDIVKYQLKRLDRNRSKCIFLIKKRLSNLTIESMKIKNSNKSNVKYLGAPFSYHYFYYKLNKKKELDISQ
ncbi:reverse transcriptase/maturase family protein [Spirosoma endophyticum]|uniref:Reverse transcriptase (RNA-dependent DNA polymerase) n=1 Tax=Spirosoma endophyticum TaxID=662367 RepID=A0A1I1X9M5_9BACT|nr:reverse transcriptase/maturase family protein [Spirosoma endophyticum]SFE03338.1 Reverse transcriptase (RNA-dependent DNA polymerase) [Spirosoma endophyticum]